MKRALVRRLRCSKSGCLPWIWLRFVFPRWALPLAVPLQEEYENRLKNQANESFWRISTKPFSQLLEFNIDTVSEQNLWIIKMIVAMVVLHRTPLDCFFSTEAFHLKTFQRTLQIELDLTSAMAHAYTQTAASFNVFLCGLFRHWQTANACTLVWQQRKKNRESGEWCARF